MMRNKKIKLLLYSAFLTSFAIVAATEEDEDFSSFLESLFSGDDSGDDAFANLFKPQKEPQKKVSTVEQKITELSIAEKTAFQNKLSALLSPLSSLLTQMHISNPIFGSTLYPKIVTHKALLFKTESTLLHLESIFGKLPTKELERFTKIIDTQEKTLITAITGLTKLTQKLAKPAVDIDTENDFIMGKKTIVHLALTPAEQKKILSALDEIKPKLATFENDLQKILISPEFKKLFPEIPPAQIKPGSAPRTSSYSSSNNNSYNPSHRDSGSRYSSRSPYADNYGYDYNDYDDYRYPESEQAAIGPKGTASEKEEKSKGLMPPEKEKTDKQSAETLFPQHVASFIENPLVAQLQAALEGGSLSTNPEYFTQLTAIFETLFGKSKDAHLTTLEKTIKHLEKPYDKLKKELSKKTADQSKITLEQLQAQKPDEELKSDLIEEQQEAVNDYEQTKQGLATAALRLYHLPTPHYVSTTDETAVETEKTITTQLTLPTRTANTTTQDTLCKNGRENLRKFIEFLETKAGLKSYIDTQRTHLDAQIQEFETKRLNKITTKLSEIAETELQKTATLKILHKRILELEALGKSINTATSTPKSLELHFTNPNEKITKSMGASGETKPSQERIVAELAKLIQRLDEQEPKSAAEDKSLIAKIKQSIARTEKSWNPVIATTDNQPASDETPSNNHLPGLLQKFGAKPQAQPPTAQANPEISDETPDITQPPALSPALQRLGQKTSANPAGETAAQKPATSWWSKFF
jgi:hypothetical protein